MESHRFFFRRNSIIFRQLDVAAKHTDLCTHGVPRDALRTARIFAFPFEQRFSILNAGVYWSVGGSVIFSASSDAPACGSPGLRLRPFRFFKVFFYTCRNDTEAHLSDLYCRTSGLLPFCSWPQSWLHFSFALQRHSLLKHYERLLDGPLLVSCRPIIVIAIFLCSAFRNIHNEHHLACGDSHTFRNALVKFWRNSHKFTVSRHHEFH